MFVHAGVLIESFEMSDQPRSQKIPKSALPKNATEMRDWLRLYRSRRVGPMTFIRLVREHGNATAALSALPDVALASGAKGYMPCSVQQAEAEIADAHAVGARMLCLGAPEYPALLATISDPPAILWALGTVLEKPTVALVGARNSSSLGRRMAARLAADLSEAGYAVVSGLARGIDAEAHRAALEGGTIAVQAGGVDNIYPRENEELAHEIILNGLRVSEMPMGLQPQARHFPRRNRIISGLAQAVVVIEGASRSGSLITAKDALDQGREVMAVPGNPMDARASGCNMLIRDGATLVRSAEDIMEVLQRPKAEIDNVVEIHPSPEGNLTERLLSLLGPTPIPEDILIRQAEWPADEVLSALIDLELAKKVERHSGGTIAMRI